MTGTERLKRRKTTLRRMIVTRYLWMFLAVAATVVGATVFDSGPTVSATIEAVALSDTVLYRASWSDMSNIEHPPKLTIELESQFGVFTQPLSDEAREGAFPSLRSGTLYHLRVLADYGYGGQVLATQSVRTSSATSAGVVVTFPSVDPGHGETLFLPTIEVLISDRNDEYSAWRLRYQIFEYQASPEEIDDLSGYETVLITADRQIVETYNLYPMNQFIAVLLEGLDAQGEWQVFERRLVATPLTFEGSLFIAAWRPDAIGFYAYGWVPPGMGAVFEAELWQNGRRLQTITIPLAADGTDSSLQWFSGLRRETEYTILYFVEYVDRISNQTVRRQLSENLVTTSDFYRIEASVVREGDQIRFDLTIDDPNGLLTDFAYSVYDPIHHQYLGGWIVMTDLGDGKKQASFLVDAIPTGTNHVSITANLILFSSTNVTTTLYQDIIE